ncbi:MAG: DUF948 domain-containing protein [Clostridium sp.]
MDAIGWQIGAILIGVSTLIVAINLSKLLQTSNKVVEKACRIVEYNERYINEIIENVASITKSTEDIVDMVSKVSSITKVFRFIKR